MVKDIAREETCCCHMGYSFRLAARVLLYVSSHRQDSTYHGLCYTSCGALAGMRNSSMGPPWRIDPTTHRTMSERSYHGATSRSLEWEIAQWVHPMKNWSDNPSHHERTLLPRSYIWLPHFNRKREGMFYLTTHSAHFIYGYMASDISTGSLLHVLSFDTS